MKHYLDNDALLTYLRQGYVTGRCCMTRPGWIFPFGRSPSGQGFH